MAVLSVAQRAEGWAELMDELSFKRARCGTSKTNLRAAYDALDTWVNDNAATVNQAIPQPARAELTVEAKALLFMHIVRKRYLEGA